MFYVHINIIFVIEQWYKQRDQDQRLIKLLQMEGLIVLFMLFCILFKNICLIGYITVTNKGLQNLGLN